MLCMQAQRKRTRVDLNWKRIPRKRRHVYVYVLLLLGAIVGNNISHALSDPSENEASKDTPSHVESLKAKTNLLYR